MRTIILIGGAPCTGKTSLARKLAHTYRCPWISTDVIRSWMKTLVSPQEYPALFNFSNTTAEDYYKEHSAQDSIRDELHREKPVFTGVKHFIETNDEWDVCIIEGISLRPEFIQELVSTEYRVIPLFLVDTNTQRTKDIIYSRGLWGDSETYEDWVKEIEVDVVTQTNELILDACKNIGLPYFIIRTNREETTNEASVYISEQLNKKDK
jgi:2-phosphoglycerate kinase